MAENHLMISITSKFEELRIIWDRVGMSEDQRQERMKTAVMHLENLVIEMVQEEQDMLETVKRSISQLEKALHGLSSELGLPMSQPDDHLGLIEAESFLRDHFDQLKAEKRHRLNQLDELIAQDEQYVKRLDSSPFKIRHEIPTKEELKEFKDHVVKSRTKMETNRVELTKYKQEIVNFMRKLKKNAKTDLEKLIVAEPIETLPLSDAFLNDLDQLEFSLREEYAAHLAIIKQRMAEVESELFLWWDKCHFTEAERQKFHRVAPENFDEIALHKYTNEIAKLKNFFLERQAVLDKFDQWLGMWRQKVAYEDKDKDSNRLLNRGGALLQEERERKRLERTLPIVKEDLRKMANQWQQEHKNEEFKINNVPIMDHLDQIETEYYAQKEIDKAAKLMAKKQQIESERRFGCQQTTPSKKRPIAPQSGRTTPTPMNKNPGSSASRNYVHSSLAVTRSPSSMQNQLGTKAGPSAAPSRPAGLPISGGVAGGSLKRKVNMAAAVDSKQQQLADHEDGENVQAPGFQAFTAECLGKVQSSFIQSTGSPRKMARQ